MRIVNCATYVLNESETIQRLRDKYNYDVWRDYQENCSDFSFNPREELNFDHRNN